MPKFSIYFDGKLMYEIVTPRSSEESTESVIKRLKALIVITPEKD